MTPDSRRRLERAWSELQQLPAEDLDDAIAELERRMIARAEGRPVPPPDDVKPDVPLCRLCQWPICSCGQCENARDGICHLCRRDDR